MTRRYPTRAGLLAAVLLTAILGGCSTYRPTEVMRQNGDRLFKLGDYAGAAVEYDGIANRYPGDWSAQYKLGLSLLELDKPVEAQRALEIAHTRRPDDGRISDALAESMYRQGSEQQLFAFLRERIELTESAQAYLRLARYSSAMNDPDSAKFAIDRAIELEGDRAVEPYLAAAGLAKRLGDMDTAVRRLRQAYSIDPNDARVRSGLRSLGEVPGPTLALPPQYGASVDEQPPG